MKCQAGRRDMGGRGRGIKSEIWKSMKVEECTDEGERSRVTSELPGH